MTNILHNIETVRSEEELQLVNEAPYHPGYEDAVIGDNGYEESGKSYLS